MGLNPGESNYNSVAKPWNYSRHNEEDFSYELLGTVYAMQEAQDSVFGQPGVPDTWPDGNPKTSLRILVVTPYGEQKIFKFPKSRPDKPKVVHDSLYAISGNDLPNGLINKTIRITTEDCITATGNIIQYGQGNPRPFKVEEVQNPNPYIPKEQIDRKIWDQQLYLMKTKQAQVQQPAPMGQAQVGQTQMQAPQQQQQAPIQQQVPVQTQAPAPMQAPPAQPVQQQSVQQPVQQQPVQQQPAPAPAQTQQVNVIQPEEGEGYAAIDDPNVLPF